MLTAVVFALLLGAGAAQAQDTTAPTLEIAKVSGTRLTLTFTETLAAASSLTNSAFTVKKTPAGGTETTVSLSGSPAISGATVTLTLATAVLTTDTAVKVSYTKPTSGTDNTLQDAASNEVASFTQEIDTTPPTLERGEIDGGTMTLTFDEPLDEDWIPGPSFRLNREYLLCYNYRSFCHQDVDGVHPGSSLPGFPNACWIVSTARGTMTISGNTVTIVGLRGRTVSGRCTQLYYDIDNLPSTTKKLRDLAGNELREIKLTFLDNRTAPSPWLATVTSATLALTFENALDGSSEPAMNAFRVEVANQARSVTDVDVNGYTVTLTLASAVAGGQSVRVRYDQPTSGNKLQDRNGNVVKTFGFKAAENRPRRNCPAEATGQYPNCVCPSGKQYNSSANTCETPPPETPPPGGGSPGDGNGGGGTPGGGGAGGRRSSRDDHGNTAGRATRIQPGGRTAGQLNTRNDVDYFTLTAPQDGVVAVETTGSTDTRATVWQNGVEVASADSGGAGQNFRLRVRVAAGPVVIAVRGNGRQTGRYTLRTTLAAYSVENPPPRASWE